MSENMGYVPTREEIERAEGSMTTLQKQLSAVREKDYQAAKEIADIAEITGDEVSFEGMLEEKDRIRTERAGKLRKELLDDIHSAWDRRTKYDDHDVLSVPGHIRFLFEYRSEQSDFARGDKEVILAALNRGAIGILKFIHKDYLRDKDVALAAVQANGRALGVFDEEFRADFDVAIQAVKQNGEAIQYVGEGLRGTKEIILAALASNPDAVYYVHNELSEDREFVLSVFDRGGKYFFRYLGDSLKKDHELQAKAIEKYYGNLKDVPIEDRSKELVRRAFELRNAYAASDDLSKEIPDNLANDPDFMMELIRIEVAKGSRGSTYGLLERGGALLWQKKSRVLELIQLTRGSHFGYGYYFPPKPEEPDYRNGYYYSMPEELQQDEEIMRAAIRAHGENLLIATPKMKHDKEIVTDAVNSSYGRALAIVDEDLRGDKEFILGLLANEHGTGAIYYYTTPELKQDIDVAVAAIAGDRSHFDLTVLNEVPKSILTNKAVLAAAIKRYGSRLTYGDSDRNPLPKALQEKIESYLNRPKE